MEYKITEGVAEDLFIVELSGAFSVTGMLNMLKKLFLHKNWKKGKDLLIDYRDSPPTEVEVDEITLASEFIIALDENFGSRRCAIIRPTEGISQSHFFQLLLSDKIEANIKIFESESYKEALHWVKS